MEEENSITVIVPALNEEANLTPSIETVESVVRRFTKFEIIIFNDGSSDRTGDVAREIAAKNENIRVIHHDKPKGLGYVYKAGIKLAKTEYVFLFTGDNEGTKEQIESILSLAGKADIVVPYTANPEIRPLFRQVISKAFVIVLNTIFGLRLRYYNGTVLHKSKIVNSIEIKTDSFAYQAEALIKLIKSGHSFIEVGVNIGKRTSGSSKMFELKNIINIAKSIFNVSLEVYFQERNKYNKRIVQITN